MTEPQIVYVKEEKNGGGCLTGLGVLTLILVALFLISAIFSDGEGSEKSQVQYACAHAAAALDRAAGGRVANNMMGGAKAAPNRFHCPVELVDGTRSVVIIDKVCSDPLSSRCYRIYNPDG